MKISNAIKIFLVAIVFLVNGCVTEVVSGPFKQPTAEEKQKSVSLYVQMAYMRLDRQEYERAMVALDSALKIDKNSSQALTALAVTYQYQGEKGKAEKMFRQIIRSNDKYPDAHLRFGDFLFSEKRYEEACHEFARATENDFYEKRPAAYFNLGLCHRESGNWEASERAFERCLGLQPENYPVLIELADLKFRSKNFPEAKKMFDRYATQAREKGQALSASSLWLGIQIERVFDNRDGEASLVLMLKNNYPYSSEYLEYKKSLQTR